MSSDDFVRPTTDFWQTLLTAPAPAPAPAPTPAPAPDGDAATSATFAPPYRYGYPAPLPDGRHLLLPIRKLAGAPGRAVASLIANQASFEVVRVLSLMMTDLARSMRGDVVIGLPTLGMVFAPQVAAALGHTRYVPLGYSRKFWYDEALSVQVQSLTTPTQGKRVYLDPNQLPLVAGRRAIIVDDAVSTGGTLAAVMTFLEALNVEIAGVVVAMRQGHAWRARLGAGRAALVAGVFDSPRLMLRADGWWPETAPCA